jgi:N-glycosidase YbiA
VMRGLLRQKFSSGELYEKLLATGDALLVEGNSWGDRYWGQVQGTGENHLGKLLMQVRKELKRG